MRIAVVGAGSMGSIFGGRLAEAGFAVTLIDVWREHVDKIKADGLRIEGVGGERVVPVQATADPAEVGPVDLVLVFCKSMDTRAAARSAKALLHDETIFLTLQNGLGNREVIAAEVGEERVVAGITFDGGNLLGPGHVRHTSTRNTLLGETDGRITPRIERLIAMLKEGGLEAIATDNLLGEIWGKLLVNAVGNPTCALTGCTIGDLSEYPSGCEWMRLVGEEVAAVAAAQGIRLPYPDVVEKLITNSRAAGAAKPSMLQDIEKERWTEIDFINGAVVREGARLGVPTPYNLALTLMVRMVQARQHGKDRVFWEE